MTVVHNLCTSPALCHWVSWDFKASQEPGDCGWDEMGGWDTAFPLLSLQWGFPTYSPSTQQPGKREYLRMQGTHGCWGGL